MQFSGAGKGMTEEGFGLIAGTAAHSGVRAGVGGMPGPGLAPQGEQKGTPGCW